MGDGVWREARMLIDGALVDAGDGATFDNVDPATEEVLGVAADGSAAEHGRRDRRGPPGVRRDRRGRPTSPSGCGACASSTQRLLAPRRGAAGDLVAEVGAPVSLTHGAAARHADRGRGLGRRPGRGLRVGRGPRRRQAVRHRLPPLRGARADRGRRRHHAVELPDPDQPGQGRARPWRPATPSCSSRRPTRRGRRRCSASIVAEETDIPAGVFNVVTSSGHEVGQLLAEDPRVDLVSLHRLDRDRPHGDEGRRRQPQEGVPRARRQVGRRSCSTTPTSPTAPASTGFQVMTHAGQGCAITTRLLLPASRYDEGVEAVDRADELAAVRRPARPGQPDGSAHQRPPARAGAGLHRRRRVAEGATVALGGGVPATVREGLLRRADGDRRRRPRLRPIAQEEIFGPVLVVQRLRRRRRRGGHRQQLGVRAVGRGALAARSSGPRAVAARIRTGTLSINGGLYYGPDVPFGGYKQSGIGREMGRAGFEEYLETKSIAGSRRMSEGRRDAERRGCGSSGEQQHGRPSCSGRRLEADPDGEYLDVCGTKLTAAEVASIGQPDRHVAAPTLGVRPRRPGRDAHRELGRGDARLVGHRLGGRGRGADQHRLQGRVPAPPAARLRARGC